MEAGAGRQTFYWDLQLWQLVTFNSFDLQTPSFLHERMYSPFQNTARFKIGSIFRVGFSLSKSPHLHRGYLVTICKRMFMTVRPKLSYIPLRNVSTFLTHFSLCKSYFIPEDRRLDLNGEVLWSISDMTERMFAQKPLPKLKITFYTDILLWLSYL